MNRFKISFVILSSIFAPFLFSQEAEKFKVPDSLKNKGYQELIDAIYREISNPDLAAIYATSYLNMAKNENNALKIAEGFNYLSYVYEGEARLNYFDSIINYTKNLNLKEYPAYAYRNKASYYYENRNFKRALDNYLEADFYANKNGDFDLSIEINFSIGLIKTRLGYYEEALTIFKSCLDHYLQDSDDYNYLVAIYAIADTYRHLKVLDSASIYNEKGLEESLKKNQKTLYNYFMLNEGVNQYEKKNYQKALDYILKIMPYVESIPDEPNSAMGYHFLGKIYMQLNNKERAEFYLKKVDTIFMKTSDIHPELRDGYEILINNYRLEGKKELQLLYIERLLKIDSILKSNYEYLSKKLVREYDTPKLINERDIIINQLKNKNKYRSYWIVSLLILLVILSLISYYYYKRQRIIKNRFEAYMNSEPEQKTKSKENKVLPISQEIQEVILEGLEKFEAKKGYLKPNITIIDLARKFKTNSKYLSNAINFYKKESFSHYINDLRIDYVVEKLKTDKILRNYSIKAIAEEIGFGNPESFNKAFYKKTGLKPSQFIKQLNKELK